MKHRASKPFFSCSYSKTQAGCKQKMADSLVVRSKVKEAAKGMNVAGDFADALSTIVQGEINKACRRAKENGRSTVKARDL